MLNIILFIVGFILTRKDKGGSSNSDNVGNGTGVSSKTWDKIILAGVAIAVYLSVRSSYQKYTQENAFATVAKDPNGLIAQQLKTAFEPYFSFFGFNPGCDTDAVLALAPQIKNWQAVIDAYGKLYIPENLAERLRSELSNENLVKFYALLGTGANVPVTTPGNVPGTPVGSQTPAATTIGGKPSTGVYSLPGLPDIQGKDIFVLRGKVIYLKDESGKTIETVIQGEKLGIAEGWQRIAGKVAVVYYRNLWDKLLYKTRTVDAYLVYYNK